MASAAPPPPANPADLILQHGQLLTMDSAQPTAEAMAVRGGRIVAVGSDADVQRLRGSRTRVVDLHGQTVVPGFIDSHMHPRPDFPEMSRYGTLDLSPDAGGTSLRALLAKLREKARLTPAGMPIIGIGYNDSAVDGHPAIALLDQAAPANPVVLFHVSGHRLVANSRALANAGITATSADPAGGSIGHDAGGALNGQLLETAMSPVRDAIGWPNPSDRIPDADILDGYRREFRQFLSYGITGIGDAAATPASLDRYRQLLRAGLPVSIYAMTRADNLDWLLAHRGTPEWQVPGLKLDAVKIVAGNSLSGHTALLYEPYAENPTYHGMEPALQPGPLRALIARVNAAGLQAAIHANGDVEIDRVLDAYAASRDTLGTSRFANLRNRIEHASITNAAIIARVRALDLCLAPHSYILNLGARLDGYGEQRFDWIEPNRRAIDAGICVGGNSDHPVSPPRIMQRIESLVTRRAASNGRVYGPDQRLTPLEALYSFTMGSAYLQHEEQERGSISVGKRADMVVLDANPAQVAADHIGQIQVVETIIGGRTVYRRTRRGPWFGW